MVLTQRPNVMKTKVIISAIAALAMLMPGIAEARNSNRPADSGKHRTEFRMADKRHGKDIRPMHKVGRHDRPIMGTRFDHRPINGRFVNINRERLWLANGVLYRVLPARHGNVYVVIGFIN